MLNRYAIYAEFEIIRSNCNKHLGRRYSHSRRAFERVLKAPNRPAAGSFARR